MKNRYIGKFLLFSFVSLFLMGCETLDDPEVEYSPVWPLAGEWWVTYNMNGQDFGGHKKLFTYNSAANIASEMIVSGTFSNLIEGEPESLDYMVKVNSDPANKTFSASNVENLSGFDSNISIENGVVIVDGGESFSGVTTDSIYMEITFADPSVVGLSADDRIVVSGIRRTGWLEDDY
jgi:hypothetical protein